MDAPSQDVSPDIKARETRAFIFLTVVLFPLMSVALVGSYGLLIWIYQMLAGPPGG